MDEFQSMPALAGLEQAPRLSQTAEEITTPSAMTSFRGALYTATDLLPTQTITDFWQSRVVMPYISDRDRPKLDQTKVDTLIAGAGLDNFKLDASKYNDVGIYFLIENQKHRQAAARIDSLTTPSWTGTPSRAIAQFIVPMFDPANIIAGFFPAATLARGAGLMSIAGKLEGLAALTTTATTLPGRVGARAALGAVEGLVGNIPIEAMQAPMRTEMGEDYKATDSLLNLAMGSAVGGGLHVITGGLARGVKTRGKLIADHVEAQTPDVKATLLTPEGTPNIDAVKSFQHAELSKVIPAEQATQLLDTSPRIAERLTDAVIPADNVTMRDTIDLVNGVKSIDDATPESRIMADYIDAPVTTPRMISEVMTDYHDAVNKAVKTGEEVNHVELLQSAINRVQPTAAELSAAVTPQTRENVIKTAIAQTLDDRMPAVDAMLRADERIGTATLDDVKTELKQSNSPDNKLGTMGDRTMAAPDQTLKYADEVDVDAHIAQTEAKIKEMEELQKLGLYSRKPELIYEDEINIDKKFLQKGYTKFEAMSQLNELQLKNIEHFKKTGKGIPDWYYESIAKSLPKKELNSNQKLAIFLHDTQKASDDAKYNVRTKEDSALRYKAKSTQLKKSISAALESDVPVVLSLDEKGNPVIYFETNAGQVSFHVPEIGNFAVFDSIEGLKPHLSGVFKKIKLENNYKWSGLTNSAKIIDKLIQGEPNQIKIAGLYSRKPYHGTPYDIEKFDTAKIDIEILRKYSRILGDNTGIKSTELVSQLYNDFGDDAGRLLETGKIKIVESVKDLPGTHPADVKGVTFRDGQVYLVAENLSPEQIKGVVLHEIGVHVNMQNMLGDTGYNNLIKQLDNLLGENNSIRDALDFAVPKDTPSQYVAQEKLAYLIENAPNSGFVREILANIKAWLFKTFPRLQTKLNLGEADFAALGLSSFRNYARQETIADFNARPALYSTVDEIVDHTTNDLDAINNVLNKVDDYRAAFETILPEMGDIADNGVFYDLVNKSIRMTKQEAKETLFTYQQALRRETELGNPSADQAALDYLMKRIKDDLLASKKSTLWDKGRNIANEKFMEKMLDLPKAVARALTISTANQRPGTMAVNPAAEVVSIKARYQASIEAKLDEAGVMKLVENNVMNDDVMRAMDAIQRNDTEKLKTLSPESQKIARIIEDTYDSILTEMNQTGLSENKIKGYYFNQSYSHDQLRINDTPEAEWIADATKLYRNKATAEAYNIAISDMDESWFKELYRKMSTGEHDSGSYSDDGGFGGFSAAEPLRRVTTKQRKLIANDVEGAIRYHNKYGKQDLYGAISGTLDAQAKKLGLVKTLGVNYERNLMQIMDKLNKKIVIPEQRKDFRSWANYHVPLMLRAVDGRMDIPVSGMLARSSSNVRAMISMMMISKSAVAGFIGDGLNGAIQDRKLGISSLPLPLQFVKRTAMQFKHYSPEQKGIARSMGVATENLLMDAYRYNSLENNVSGVVAKATRWFYKLNLIDKQGTQMKLATMDQLGNAHAAFAQIPYDKLTVGMQRYLQRHDITAEDWGIIKHAQTKHVDGKDYLTPDTIKDLIPQARELMISKGATQEVADIAAQKYITNLQAKISKYYLDLLSRQYIEPTAASKFFIAFGTKSGTPIGEAARFATQFKQYGVNFWRNILLDEVYSRHDTAGAFAKDLFTTREGFKQGAGILWKVANFTLAGYMSWALYDIIAGRKPRALINEDGTLSKAAIAGSLMKSGGLSIFADFLFADYNRFGTSIEGMAAGPTVNVLGSGVKNLYATATGSYKTFTGEKQSPDVGARWLKFAKDLSPGVFWGSAISNYAFWYGMQEKLNPGYLHRMERNMKNLSDQEYIFPPSQNAIEY